MEKNICCEIFTNESIICKTNKAKHFRVSEQTACTFPTKSKASLKLPGAFSHSLSLFWFLVWFSFLHKVKTTFNRIFRFKRILV